MYFFKIPKFLFCEPARSRTAYSLPNPGRMSGPKNFVCTLYSPSPVFSRLPSSSLLRTLIVAASLHDTLNFARVLLEHPVLFFSPDLFNRF